MDSRHEQNSSTREQLEKEVLFFQREKEKNLATISGEVVNFMKSDGVAGMLKRLAMLANASIIPTGEFKGDANLWGFLTGLNDKTVRREIFKNENVNVIHKSGDEISNCDFKTEGKQNVKLDEEKPENT